MSNMTAKSNVIDNGCQQSYTCRHSYFTKKIVSTLWSDLMHPMCTIFSISH